MASFTEEETLNLVRLVWAEMTKYWDNMTQEEQERYTSLLRKLLKNERTMDRH